MWLRLQEMLFQQRIVPLLQVTAGIYMWQKSLVFFSWFDVFCSSCISTLLVFYFVNECNCNSPRACLGHLDTKEKMLVSFTLFEGLEENRNSSWLQSRKGHRIKILRACISWLPFISCRRLLRICITIVLKPLIDKLCIVFCCGMYVNIMLLISWSAESSSRISNRNFVAFPKSKRGECCQGPQNG